MRNVPGDTAGGGDAPKAVAVGPGRPDGVAILMTKHENQGGAIAPNNRCVRPLDTKGELTRLTGTGGRDAPEVPRIGGSDRGHLRAIRGRAGVEVVVLISGQPAPRSCRVLEPPQLERRPRAQLISGDDDGVSGEPRGVVGRERFPGAEHATGARFDIKRDRLGVAEHWPLGPAEHHPDLAAVGRPRDALASVLGSALDGGRDTLRAGCEVRHHELTNTRRHDPEEREPLAVRRERDR